MPYLQLDVNDHYPTAPKQLLAKRRGDIYAAIMQAEVKRITVAIRELGEGAVWRCGDGDPVPAALLMCDIRRGRDVETRAALAEALIACCMEVLGLEMVNVEFTQHAGDEMYHPLLGGWSGEWEVG